jgi:hypothetical protein
VTGIRSSSFYCAVIQLLTIEFLFLSVRILTFFRENTIKSKFLLPFVLFINVELTTNLYIIVGSFKSTVCVA